MKTKTLTQTTTFIIAVALVFGMGAATAFAESESRNRGDMNERRGERQEMRRDVRAGVRGDIKEAREDFRQELTDEQVDILEESRELFESGDKEGARALLDDAGIVSPRMEVRQEILEQHTAIKDAIEAGDYEAFQQALAGTPFDQVEISEEQFNQMQEVHSLIKGGEFQEARELAQELGLPMSGKRMQKRFANNLSADEKEIVREAHDLAKDGDVEGARTLLDEADIKLPQPRGFFQRVTSWLKK